MAEKTNWLSFSNILSFIMLILLIMAIWTGRFKPAEDTEDKGGYDYCVGWSGYNREDLLWTCYNFREQKIVCDWTITDDGDLFLTDYYNQSKVLQYYKCGRWVKSVPGEPVVAVGVEGVV